MAKDTDTRKGLLEVVATSTGYAPLGPGQHCRMIKAGTKLFIAPEGFSKNWMAMADGSEPPVVKKAEIDRAKAEKIQGLKALSIDMVRRLGNALDVKNVKDLSKAKLVDAIVAAEEKALASKPGEPTPDQDPDPAASDEGPNISKMKKADLIALCEERDLESEGTVKELRERLAEAAGDEDTPPAE